MPPKKGKGVRKRRGGMTEEERNTCMSKVRKVGFEGEQGANLNVKIMAHAQCNFTI